METNQPKKKLTFNNILFGAGVSLALAAMVGTAVIAVDPYVIDRVSEAQAIAAVSHPEIPTRTWASVGYGETCMVEVWDVPSQYQGIRDWKNAEPSNARFTSVTKAGDPNSCKKNFNASNPAKPLTPDYANQYNRRPEDIITGNRA